MNCPHGMPKPANCTECMAEGPVAEPVTWMRVGQPFPAQYGGSTCRGCTVRVDAGDLIQRWDYGDDETRYLHAGCRP